MALDCPKKKRYTCLFSYFPSNTCLFPLSFPMHSVHTLSPFPRTADLASRVSNTKLKVGPRLDCQPAFQTRSRLLPRNIYTLTTLTPFYANAWVGRHHHGWQQPRDSTSQARASLSVAAAGPATPSSHRLQSAREGTGGGGRQSGTEAPPYQTKVILTRAYM